MRKNNKGTTKKASLKRSFFCGINKINHNNMANIDLLMPKILKWEGGFGIDPVDKGGATNMGITLQNWKLYGYDKDGDGDVDVDDLKIITKDDFEKFFKAHYWDHYWKADNINNQSVANILVDWCYNSGGWGVKIPQTILGCVSDGIVGTKTLGLVNTSNQQDLFQKIWDARKKFYSDIVDKSITEYKKINPNPTEKDLLSHTQKRFLAGWLNRLNDYKF
jgi:lysozyme family protein